MKINHSIQLKDNKLKHFLNINKLSNINNLLKNNDSLSMAFKIISKNKISKTNSSNDNENQKLSDLNKNYFNNNKINKIINNLKLLVK